jgi:transcriptional regulator with XRE-family HTH domain
MNVVLTPTTAKELGRALRFMRHARTLTLRDIAREAGLSSQYVQNIERGERTNVSEDAYARLARALGVPERVVGDLLLKARVQAALDARGIATDTAAFVWRGIEQRLEERGLGIRTDLAAVVADLLMAQGFSEVHHDSTAQRKGVVHNRAAEPELA